MEFTFKKKRYEVIFSWKFPFIRILKIINSVKPTSSNSISCNMSTGIEPLYNSLYIRKILKNEQ